MTAAKRKSSRPSGVAALIPTLARKAPAAAPAPPPVEKSNHLEIADQPGKTHDRLLADVVAQGLVVNASTAMRFVKPEYSGLSLTDMVASLRESGEAMTRNDMALAERMLYAQTVALNAMFGEMARVAHCNLFKNPEVADRYMRLSLRAQSQSRATVETLAAMKNPPAVFTRQANFGASACRPADVARAGGGRRPVSDGDENHSEPPIARDRMKRLRSAALCLMQLCFAAVCYATTSSGTGFFITPTGYIATNFHVVRGAVWI